MAEPWRSETEGEVVDGTGTLTPESTTCAGRTTAQGVVHAMEAARTQGLVGDDELAVPKP